MLSGDCVNEDSSTCTHNHYFTLSCLCLFTLVLCLCLPHFSRGKWNPGCFTLLCRFTSSYAYILLKECSSCQEVVSLGLIPSLFPSRCPSRQRYSKALLGGLSTGNSLWTKLTSSLSSGSLLVKLCIRPVFWQKSRGCYRNIQKGDPSCLGSHLNLKMRPKECWLGSEKKGTIMNCRWDANWCSCCGKRYGGSSRN